ncbi:MAG: tyrosine/phenylalanine carboxypeptidase domain-containing protein, partial [Polyangiales bacterium]
MSRSDGDAPRAAAREPSTKDAPIEPAANENGAAAAPSAPAQKATKGSDSPAAAKGVPVTAFPPPGTPRPADVEAILHPRVDTATMLPSIPPMPAAGPWRSYKEIVASLSGRVVDAQKPIRVLNSIKWDPSVWETFKRSRFRDVPIIGPDSYTEELGFDPKQKVAEFDEIARDIEKDLPATDEIANILRRTALEFRDVVRMLEARGTPTFYAYSRKLYGSPKDKYPDGKTTVRDSAFVLYDLLTNLQDELGAPSPRDVPAAKAVDILNARLTAYFGESTVRVAEDDGIFADAAAGSDYVKIRRGAQFTMRDIDILEVHEGWVHLASSLNGQAQPVAKWLSKGPPRTTAAQEGLA